MQPRRTHVAIIGQAPSSTVTELKSLGVHVPPGGDWKANRTCPEFAAVDGFMEVLARRSAPVVLEPGPGDCSGAFRRRAAGIRTVAVADRPFVLDLATAAEVCLRAAGAGSVVTEGSIREAAAAIAGEILYRRHPGECPRPGSEPWSGDGLGAVDELLDAVAGTGERLVHCSSRIHACADGRIFRGPVAHEGPDLLRAISSGRFNAPVSVTGSALVEYVAARAASAELVVADFSRLRSVLRRIGLTYDAVVDSRALCHAGASAGAALLATVEHLSDEGLVLTDSVCKAYTWEPDAEVFEAAMAAKGVTWWRCVSGEGRLVGAVGVRGKRLPPGLVRRGYGLLPMVVGGHV